MIGGYKELIAIIIQDSNVYRIYRIALIYSVI